MINQSTNQSISQSINFPQVHPGRWLVDGNPQIILFDIGSASVHLDDYKRQLYENTKIGIPSQDIECNDAVIFGFMVAKFIEEVGKGNV